MTGAALGGGFDYGEPRASAATSPSGAAASAGSRGSSSSSAHNLIYSASATAGHNLPFWNENTAGGNNLRGYLGQQFRGDTQLGGKLEYHFPLFSIGSLDFRALGVLRRPGRLVPERAGRHRR